MARKRKTDYPLAGRPPKDPEEKVGQPVRCLVTIGVAEALLVAGDNHGIKRPRRGVIPSDTLRLALYEFLERRKLMDETLREDPTWDTLKQQGLV